MSDFIDGADEILSAYSDAADYESRRRHTNALNRKLANIPLSPVPPETLDYDALRERAIYIEARDEVVLLPPAGAQDNGRILLCVSPKHFKQLLKGNVAAHPTRVTRQGVPVIVDAAELWMSDLTRQTMRDAMYAIGRPRFIEMPGGEPAVNLWTPNKRILVGETDITLFHEHIAYLIPGKEDRERFLNWLAHCEQKPDKLPHHGWLMWTERFGVGRNWLASALLRVWQGEVAPSLDLVALLDGAFNDSISCKRLAVVDEIHFGSGSSMFTLAARLRQLLTQEVRSINPKYGKKTSEFNATRWLIFSNHADALPMPEDDRRFEVVRNPSEVKSEAYYAQLYNALDDPKFIAGIAHFLATRDIKDYNAGARPRMTEAKRHVIEATIGEKEKDMRLILDDWKAAGILMFVVSDLKSDLQMDAGGKEVIHHPLLRYGAKFMKRTKWKTENAKLYAISEEAETLLKDPVTFAEATKRIFKERGEDGLFASARHTGPRGGGSSGAF